MNEIEVTGKTMDEALAKAITNLGIKKENASVEVIEEPNNGILGFFGTKNARLLVKADKNPGEYIESYLKELINYMGIEGTVNVYEDDMKLKAEINGQDVGTLIGRRGRTLSDIQYLLSVVLRRQFNNYKKMIIIDIENYRERREKTLTQLAKSVARRVNNEECEIELEPMTPQERRVIHLALQDHKGVTTRSVGDEPYRKVVIVPR